MTRPLAVAIAAAFVVVPALASARPRVAFVPIQGDTGGEAQDAVSDAVDPDLSVLGGKEVTRTVDKLGMDSENLSDKDLKKLTNELDVDAIVVGTLGKKDNHKLLHFKLAVHGKKVKGFSIEFGSLKSPKFKQALHDTLVDRISGTGGAVADDEPKKGKKTAATDEEDPIGGKTAATTKKGKKGKKAAADEAPPADEDTPKKKKATDDVAADDDAAMKKKSADDAAGDEDKPKKKQATDDDAAMKKKSADDAAGDEDKPKKKQATDDDAAADDDKPKHGKKRTAAKEGDDDADASVEAGVTVGKVPEHSANRAAFRVDLGLSVSTRNLTFASRAFEQAPKAYTNSPVPGARFEAALYPLAFGNPNSLAAGLGIAASFDQTLSLSLQSTAQPGTKFPVTERHYSVGGRFRIVFGKKPTSPSVTLGAGYTRRSFIVNRSALMQGNIIDLPDVDYVGFDPGVEFRIPLAAAVALTLGGQAILVTKAGPIQSNDSYGQARITAGQGSAGFDIMFTSKVGLRISGEFAQFGYKFTGTGTQAINRDGDPTTPDVGGAADRYIGGAGTLTVLY